MTQFEKWTGREARALREASRRSVREFAKDLKVSDRTISNWESAGSEYVPRANVQRILDAESAKMPDEARARFEKILETDATGIANLNPVSANHARNSESGALEMSGTLSNSSVSESLATPQVVTGDSAWAVMELIERLEHSDVSPGKIELLMGTVNRLSTEYGSEAASSLHPKIGEWIRRVTRALDSRTTLSQHRELLVCAGWLFLLSGCVEYDMGWKDSAETSRLAALRIGRETGHGEIQAWAWEMAAWFALTQGQLEDVAGYVEAGQRVGDTHTIIVQLDAQLAKAAARMGDTATVEKALESGYTKLSRMPRPDNPRNHFVIDPDKWDFYAMDAYRLLGDDVRASRHAKEVLRLGQGPDGKELAPMRMAEARLTLGVSAARSGELEEAVTVGESAFSSERKSLPTLFMVAGELESELTARYPKETPTKDYREKLVELRRESAPKFDD